MSRLASWMCVVWSLTFIGLGCTPPPAPPAAAPPPAAEPPPPAAPIKAEAGVGKQGQSLKNEGAVGRFFAQPAITLFTVKQRVVFEIQIPQAMNLYQASNGYKPKSHDEFMTHIIKANNIALPILPEGQVYKYHPDEGVLYVHPAKE
ncbi:MAG: hypothetical protein IT423_10655 [Pirellulaceae bacterium]|nr:hypothetical protein [Pirellulaceae bacterium]